MFAEFSEFSYGFAFTHEYISHTPGLTAAPELPSLIDEADKGYDLKLGYKGHPRFFQFKLSVYLNRSNAIHWSYHHQAHYRVRLTTRVRPNQLSGTDQHSQLKRLADIVGSVYYVAPKFHSQAVFDALFSRGIVTTNSLWAPLESLPCVHDNEVHYMTFTRSDATPSWHSEPFRLEGKFTAEEHYAAMGEAETIDEEFFRNLRLKLLVASREVSMTSSGMLDLDNDIASILRDTHRLLTTRFGLRMVILTEDGGQ